MTTPQTLYEEMFWDRLKTIPKIQFIPQGKVLNFTPDFWCPQLKLAIEIDGKYHKKRDIKLRDAWREQLLKDHKIFVLRFTNKQVEKNVDECLKTVFETVKRLKRKQFRSRQLKVPRFKFDERL